MFITELQVVSFFSRVKLNSTNWPSPNVWVFIAQLVEHCRANTEVMGSNPVEVPNLGGVGGGGARAEGGTGQGALKVGDPS